MDDLMRLRWLPFIYCCMITFNILPLFKGQQDDEQQSTQRLSKMTKFTLATDVPNWEQENFATISDHDNFHAIPKPINSDTSHTDIQALEEKDEVYSSVKTDPLSKEGKDAAKSSIEPLSSRSILNEERSRILKDGDNFRHVMLRRFLQTLNIPLTPGDYLVTNDTPVFLPPTSEYMQALFYAVSTDDTRLANLPVETHKGEQVVWGIKAFNVSQISVDLIEASFHLALNYEPDIISRVELVLEHRIVQQEDQKTKRASQATNRQRYHVEACSAPQNRNLRKTFHNLSKERFTEEPALNENILTNFTIIEERKPVTVATTSEIHSPTLTQISLDKILKSQLTLNISRESSKHGTNTESVGKIEKLSENIKEQDMEMPNEPFDCHRFVTGRRRFNSKTHEYDVFNVTKAFLAWWPDCVQQINSSFNMSCSSGTSMLRLIKSGGPSIPSTLSKSNLFNGDALLIIYKNVAADIRKTRRVLKNLPAEKTVSDNVKTSESNTGGSISPKSKRRKRSSNTPSGARENSNVKGEITPARLEESSVIQPPKLCHLQSWRVDFARMGWTWIISPTSFEANFCTGSCEIGPREFDLVNLTNNAFLRSVYRRLTGDLKVPAPSCVPLRTHPMNILYRRDDETIVLRRVNEITAEECGCL